MRKIYLVVPLFALALIYSTPTTSNAQSSFFCTNPIVHCTCGGPGNNHACYGTDIINPGKVVTHQISCPAGQRAVSGGYVTFDADNDQSDELPPAGLQFTILQSTWTFSGELAPWLIVVPTAVPTGWAVTLDNESNSQISEATCVNCCGSNNFAATTAPK